LDLSDSSDIRGSTPKVVPDSACHPIASVPRAYRYMACVGGFAPRMDSRRNCATYDDYNRADVLDIIGIRSPHGELCFVWSENLFLSFPDDVYNRQGLDP
jgi:hypothetical protein